MGHHPPTRDLGVLARAARQALVAARGPREPSVRVRRASRRPPAWSISSTASRALSGVDRSRPRSVTVLRGLRVRQLRAQAVALGCPRRLFARPEPPADAPLRLYAPPPLPPALALGDSAPGRLLGALIDRPATATRSWRARMRSTFACESLVANDAKPYAFLFNERGRRSSPRASSAAHRRDRRARATQRAHEAAHAEMRKTGPAQPV